MIFLEIDLTRQLVSLSNAGHNPMLYYNAEKSTCRMVSLPGMALNLTSKAEFQIKELKVKPDDFLLIYTDGVTESVNVEMEMFEDKRLIEAVQESADLPVEEIISHLREKVDSFTGEMVQSDDILMFGLKFK